MRVTTSLVLVLVLLAAAPAYVLSDEQGQCDCSVQAQQAAQKAVQNAVAQVTEAQQKCDANLQAIKTQHQKQLQERENALSSSCSDKTTAASKTIEQLRTQLDTSGTHLQQLRTQLTDAEQKLQAAEAHSAKLAASSSASGASMASLRAELEAAKDKLAALEKAWVPVPAQNWLAEATACIQKWHAQATASEYGQKVQKVAGQAQDWVVATWQQAEPHVHAYLHTAQLKLKAVLAQAEVLYHNHINDADWLKQVHLKFDRVQGELRVVVKQLLRDAPAPIKTSDPVMVQYVVYLVMATPGLIVVWLLAALTCGTRKPARTSSSGSSRTSKGGKRARV